MENPHKRFSVLQRNSLKDLFLQDKEGILHTFLQLLPLRRQIDMKGPAVPILYPPLDHPLLLHPVQDGRQRSCLNTASQGKFFLTDPIVVFQIIQNLRLTDGQLRLL